ncbi:hypothetical protein RRG08_000244 [Elysia crispata]|uniref:Uncharacterized protein n=1 Tax=Elysia crispata TaxID=231223 RepID=A0AAE1AY22_9GAST|nr:hypothetical protein RRG08_000244 [Elysia crispata]
MKSPSELEGGGSPPPPGKKAAKCPSYSPSGLKRFEHWLPTDADGDGRIWWRISRSMDLDGSFRFPFFWGRWVSLKVILCERFNPPMKSEDGIQTKSCQGKCRLFLTGAAPLPCMEENPKSSSCLPHQEWFLLYLQYFIVSRHHWR